MITIPGRLRETAFEILFGHDNERNSLPYLVLDAISQCPVDIRKPLSENMFLIGGTVMAPGMTARVKAELWALIKQPLYSKLQDIKEIKFHSAPAKPNLASWLGGKWHCFIKIWLNLIKICFFHYRISLWWYGTSTKPIVSARSISQGRTYSGLGKFGRQSQQIIPLWYLI